jgi:hypothetical protein
MRLPVLLVLIAWVRVAAHGLAHGGVAFDPSLPFEDVSATLHQSVVGYVRTFGLAGRLASIGAVAPYTVGSVDGLAFGTYQKVYRSGLRDPHFRFAVNLTGVPAMDIKRFAEYRRKTIVGVSVSLVAPLGQYDPARLVNIGSNRWAFKPEIGLSQAWKRWTFELYTGVWLFTKNTNFQGRTREQDPIGSSQIHVTYTIRPRFWLSFNSNFYIGGRTTLDGRRNFDLQRNSRMGITSGIPIARRQSLKLSYSRGAYTTIGADFTAVGVAYQYMWGGGLK